jgi:hypothetical protein
MTAARSSGADAITPTAAAGALEPSTSGVRGQSIGGLSTKSTAGVPHARPRRPTGRAVPIEVAQALLPSEDHCRHPFRHLGPIADWSRGPWSERGEARRAGLACSYRRLLSLPSLSALAVWPGEPPTSCPPVRGPRGARGLLGPVPLWAAPSGRCGTGPARRLQQRDRRLKSVRVKFGPGLSLPYYGGRGDG